MRALHELRTSNYLTQQRRKQRDQFGLAVHACLVEDALELIASGFLSNPERIRRRLDRFARCRVETQITKLKLVK